MTPQELKASILQLAIQGKLVEQRPEEGTGEELYQQIQAEKQLLIKAGKIKKEKPLPEITEDEIAFDIPDTWKHVKLGEVFCLEMGQSPDGNTVSETGDGIEFHQGKVYFSKMELQLSPQKTTSPTKYAQPDSALLCVRAPVGKVNITKRKVCIGRGLCAVKPICGISVEFVYYWLATLENTFIKKATGTTFVAITGEVVKNQVIPLPPLAEQMRIVAKLEELLPLIDRYEQAWSKLEEFNKRFPVDMQKSILQMAIQGKLVPQLPEEESVDNVIEACRRNKEVSIKEGKYRKEPFRGRIIDEAIIPYDIPDSWAWMYISDISLFQEGPGILAVDFRTSGVPLIRIAGMQSDVVSLDGCNYLDEEMVNTKWNHFRLDEGDIVISTSASMDKIAEVESDTVGAIPYTGLIRFKMYGGISKEYFKWFIKSPFYAEQVNEQKAGGTIKHYGPSHLKKMLIPIPPIAEQKRIVAKLEEILPLCERLK